MDKCLSCSCCDDGKKKLVELLPFEGGVGGVGKQKQKESKRKVF